MIRTEHGHLDQLKSNVSAAALGMASSGWVWFVTDNHGRTAVLPTFGAGTLLVRSRANVSPFYGPIIGEDFSTWRSATLLTAKPVPKRASAAAPAPAPATHTPNRSLHTPTTNDGDFTDLESPPASIYDDHIPTDPEDTPPRPPGPRPPSNTTTTGSEIKFTDELVDLGEMLCPLFCISVHEHAWMSAGYGVWGKEEWLKKFWTVLDWSKVSKTYARFTNKQTV